MTAAASSPWWVVPRRRAAPRVKLFCFPYAGASASAFRTWPDAVSEDVDVYALQLPGRANRLCEVPYTSVEPAVRDLCRSMLPELDRPFALFGHSLGAMLAFETARYLRRTCARSPLRLFVSGRRAPQVADTDPPQSGKDDAGLIAALRELNGTPPEVLGQPEMLDVVLPVLRADFQLAESYRYRAEPPLACPITAFGGTWDEESHDGRLQAWSVQTSGGFASYGFDGDHFFIIPHEAEILARILRELRL